jgi:lipopolysaccharide/colanic/teichoic acid biosynthesis glycosyltransferase
MDLMVTLDLVYCRRWSPLLDLTILLRTPFAVFTAPSLFVREDSEARA